MWSQLGEIKGTVSVIRDIARW